MQQISVRSVPQIAVSPGISSIQLPTVKPVEIERPIGMSAVALVPPCYSQSGDNPAANNIAGAQVPCDPTQLDCVDANGLPCAQALQSAFLSAPASSANTTGAIASGGATASGPTALNTTSLVASLGAIAAQTYTASTAPSNKVTIGATGIAAPASSLGTIALLAVAVIVGVLVFKK
jgi:hypothetical protein